MQNIDPRAVVLSFPVHARSAESIETLTTWFSRLDLNMTRKSGIASALLAYAVLFRIDTTAAKTTSVLESGAASCSNNERVGGGK